MNACPKQRAKGATALPKAGMQANRMDQSIGLAFLPQKPQQIHLSSPKSVKPIKINNIPMNKEFHPPR